MDISNNFFVNKNDSESNEAQTMDNIEPQKIIKEIDTTWNHSIEVILHKIQEQSLHLSNRHKRDYVVYKRLSDRFKAPCIILSSVATLFNFGLQPYLPQQTVTIICTVITFTTGLLTTIELWLQLNKKMEKELMLSKSMYMLYMDIYKVLALKRSLRESLPSEFLEEKYRQFQELIEISDTMPGDLFERLGRPLENGETEFIDVEKKYRIYF